MELNLLKYRKNSNLIFFIIFLLSLAKFLFFANL